MELSKYFEKIKNMEEKKIDAEINRIHTHKTTEYERDVNNKKKQ